MTALKSELTYLWKSWCYGCRGSVNGCEH